MPIMVMCISVCREKFVSAIVKIQTAITFALVIEARQIPH